MQRRTLKFKHAPRNSPILQQHKFAFPTPNSFNSGHCGCVGRGGIHFFGRASEGSRPPSSYGLDDHKKEAQTRLLKPPDNSPHPRKFRHPALSSRDNSTSLGRIESEITAMQIEILRTNSVSESPKKRVRSLKCSRSPY